MEALAGICTICRDGRGVPLYRNCRSRRAGLAERFDLMRCQGCGVVFLFPRPTAETLVAFYSGEYPSHIVPATRAGHLLRFIKKLCLLPYRLRFGDEGGTSLPFGEGRLLDVGCGIGDYLTAMAPLGWECFGCDVSEPALKVARSRLPKATLVCGTLEECAFQPASFAAVTLWHTLEHLEDPLGTLEHVYRLLVPDGRLVLATPNIASLEARMLGSRWAGIDVPFHLFIFSVETLRALVKKAGFECTRLRPQVHPSTVSDALDFYLDDLLRVKQWRQRMLLYYLLYPATAISYVLGNWGCLELTAVKPGRA